MVVYWLFEDVGEWKSRENRHCIHAMHKFQPHKQGQIYRYISAYIHHVDQNHVHSNGIIYAVHTAGRQHLLRMCTG